MKTITKQSLIRLAQDLIIQAYRRGKNSKFKGYLTRDRAKNRTKIECHSIESIISNYEIK